MNSMKKYQIVRKGNGKFFIQFVNERIGASCMVTLVYYDSEQEAKEALKKEKLKRKEFEKLNKETVVYEETV